MFWGKKFFKTTFVASEVTYWVEEGLMDSASEEYGLEMERQVQRLTHIKS